jgi:hypothetical protein
MACGFLGLGLAPQCLVIDLLTWFLHTIVPIVLVIVGFVWMLRGRQTLGAVVLLFGIGLFAFFKFAGG